MVRRSQRLKNINHGRSHLEWSASSRQPLMHMWAPEIHNLDGQWYIYFAADNGRNRNHRMYVLKSTTPTPEGRYRLIGKLKTGGWAIDGTLLEHDGVRYFIWSGWPGDKNVTQNLYIAKMASPDKLVGKRVMISRPQYEWEGRINEGPEVLKHKKRIFVIYSANASWTDDYCLGNLELVGNDPMNPESWRKYPAPAFCSSQEIFGPGHASFVKSLDGRQSWIVYHAAQGSGAGWSRQVRARPFRWNKQGFPVFGKPV
jgi:GH43 family beta-xylosidase